MTNIGIIGAGRIGKVHATSIQTKVPGARVKAIADPIMSEETIHWAQEQGIEEIFEDYHEILNDPDIDAVLICSSTDTHSPISIEAIRAGKHVFCEKPIDHDVKRIKEVIAALEGTDLKYQVGFNRRFDHNFCALKKEVQDGKVGIPEIILITSRDPEPPPIDYIKVSGGMFMDMTIHDFDMARFLSESDAEEVYVQSAVNVDQKIGEAGDVDTAIITLKMKNGVLVVIDNCRRAAYGYDQRAEVFGSEGLAIIGNDTPNNVKVAGFDGVHSEKPLYFFLQRYMDAYAEELNQFIRAIQKGEDTPLGVYDGLEPILIALAAQRSNNEHRPVRIMEILEEININ